MIRIEEGQECTLGPNDELPYKLLRNLGQGGFANVEEVEDQHTGEIFARKVFRTNNATLAETQRLLANEVKVIQRLAPHHHVVRVFATYVRKREIGILLKPVANRGSLEIFLQDTHDGSFGQSELNILYNSFGCLASGIRFMHASKVRHKDIKPSNILVHGESLIYTDFGSSLDHSAATRSVTTGRPGSMTQKYAAPELKEELPRSFKTDMFSLACVFLEILSALELGPLDTKMSPYREHTEAFSTMMHEIRHSCDIWLQTVIDMTCQMLDVKPEARPSAETITIQLWMCQPYNFCGQCQTDLAIQMRVEDSICPIHNRTAAGANCHSPHTLYDDTHRPRTSSHDASQWRRHLDQQISMFWDDSYSYPPKMARRFSSDDLNLESPQIPLTRKILQPSLPAHDHKSALGSNPRPRPIYSQTRSIVPNAGYGHPDTEHRAFSESLHRHPLELRETVESTGSGTIIPHQSGSHHQGPQHEHPHRQQPRDHRTSRLE